MKLPKLITPLLISAAMLSSVSCGNEQVIKQQEQQTSITLSWWGNDKRNDYTIEAMQIFEEMYPDIKVMCNYSEWSGYEARTRVRMASDTESDVMQINVGWLKEYSPDGNGYYDIEKLSDYVDLSAFPEEMLEYGRVNGVLNAVPIAMNAQTVYINRSVYEKYGLDVPETWDDLFSAAKVMSADGVYPISAGSKSTWLTAIAYAEQQSGKPILNDDGSLCFGQEEFRIMIGFYCDMVNNNVMPQVEFYERINIDNGTYAGTIAWVSDAVNYCGKAMETGFDVVPGPYLTNGKVRSGDGWYAKPATLYAISKNTEHPREAAMLLNYMLNSKEMAVLQGVEKGIPISSSAREFLDEEGQLTGLQYDASVVMETNSRIRKMDPFLENASLIDVYVENCDLVLYDKGTIEEASDALYQAVREARNSK